MERLTVGDWIYLAMFLTLFLMILDMGYNKNTNKYSFLLPEKK